MTDQPMQTMSAATDANLANSLIAQALAQPEEEQTVPILTPLDTHVKLPTGYLKVLSGEVVTSAEVRELTGRDEEALSKEPTVGRQINAILRRGVVSIGDERATDDMLSQLLAGDRDELLLGIYKATFGNPAELNGWCDTCLKTLTVGVDLNSDIERKLLADPIDDRKFTVKGRKSTYLVHLPAGSAQKEMNELADSKTVAELSTIMLEHCVLEINGQQVFNKNVIKDIGVTDRRAILEEIYSRNPGPQLTPQTVECPDCGSEVVVPVALGALFQL